MGCAFKQNQHGFTLVEISIVMIIIGLLIGGTFGGMKLIDNMQVNRTVQDLKAIESAALTFKDTYGRLPGDIVNPAARLPSCTSAPCSTGGNGNRVIGTNTLWNAAMPAPEIAQENVTFWHHLSAADLMAAGIKGSTDLAFGESQPESPVGGGYRISDRGNGPVTTCPKPVVRTIAFLTSTDTGLLGWGATVPCALLSSIDRKFDDNSPVDGSFMAFWGCESSGSATCGSTYVNTASGTGMYDFKGF